MSMLLVIIPREATIAPVKMGMLEMERTVLVTSKISSSTCIEMKFVKELHFKIPIN